jgi:hypothetical protein
MNVAYLSIDEVNQATARELAEAHRAGFDLLSMSDPQANGQFDAVVYDFDSLPADCRRPILAQLLAGRWSRRRAVHGYGLAEELVRALRSRGVLVARKLTPELFACLLRSRGTREPAVDAMSLSYQSSHYSRSRGRSVRHVATMEPALANSSGA